VDLSHGDRGARRSSRLSGSASGLLLLGHTNRNLARAKVVAISDGAGTDLAVTPVAVPPSAAFGSDVTYQARVDNFGTLAASNVHLAGGLPAGVEIRALTTGQGSCAWSASALECELGTLSAGGATIVSVTLRPTRPGTLILTLGVSAGDACDPSAGNNVTSLLTEVADRAVRRRLRAL
jgi:uncharacterized repeat protein (TIGR01451 family)